MSREEKSRRSWPGPVGRPGTMRPLTDIPGRTRVIAISSGKGGVGKSSVTVNLAAALANRGYTVGRARCRHRRLLGSPHARHRGPDLRRAQRADPQRPEDAPDREAHRRRAGSRCCRWGSCRPEDEAIMWRGLMLNRAVQHFLEDAVWGDLDYLLVDMPPGTGRHPDGAGPDAAPDRDDHRDHPGPGGPEGGRPGRRHGPQGLPPGGRRGGKHERLRPATTASLRPVRHRRRRPPGRRDRRPAARPDPARGRRLARAATSAMPASLGTRSDRRRPSRALADAVLEAIPVVEMQDCTARLFDQIEAVLGPKPTPAATV